MVKNLSQLLKFSSIVGLFFAFISARWCQNDFQTPGLSYLAQSAQFTWKFCASWLNSFWVSKENIANWQNTDFLTKMGQMDLSCPRPIQTEGCQTCRETIPLVQVYFRFELSLTVLKLLSKIWVNFWKFWANFGCFFVFIREMASEKF